jgi:hypothetical protein
VGDGDGVGDDAGAAAVVRAGEVVVVRDVLDEVADDGCATVEVHA